LSNTPLIDADKLFHRLQELGEDWADKDAAYKALDDATKSVLAEQALQWTEQGKSAAEADTRARASQPYKDHLHALSEARRAANRARVNYENAKAWVDMKRTNASTERALATMR